MVWVRPTRNFRRLWCCIQRGMVGRKPKRCSRDFGVQGSCPANTKGLLCVLLEIRSCISRTLPALSGRIGAGYWIGWPHSTVIFMMRLVIPKPWPVFSNTRWPIACRPRCPSWWNWTTRARKRLTFMARTHERQGRSLEIACWPVAWRSAACPAFRFTSAGGTTMEACPRTFGGHAATSTSRVTRC